MEYDEIQAALEQRDLPQIEDAFRAFIDNAGEGDLTGFGSAVEMMGLFEQICQALAFDESSLPDKTAVTMSEFAERSDQQLAGRTYAAAAELAFTHLSFFRTEFERRFVKDTPNG